MRKNILLLVFVLAACQQRAATKIAVDDDTATPLNVAHLPAEQAATEAGKTGIMPPRATVLPPPRVPLDQPIVPTPTRIPEQFWGRWGLVEADCEPGRSDAKGLLTISDSRLTFFESKGELAKVIEATLLRFDARYHFVGEGQTWLRTERLERVHDRLHRRTDAEPGQEPPVDLRYLRCPG